MNTSSTEGNNNEPQKKPLDKSTFKFTPKVKIGKEIFLYRTLYLKHYISIIINYYLTI